MAGTAQSVSLYDVVLRSLKHANRAGLAAELARFRVAVSEDTLASPESLPLTLARYAGPKVARSIRDSLLKMGALVSLHVSQLTCPHCGFSVECVGEPAADSDAVVFCCRACQGLTQLDLGQARFRSVIRCDACGSLVQLPDRAASGTYTCSCGAPLSYAPVKHVVPLESMQGPSRKRQFVLALSLLVLAAVLIHSSWLAFYGPPEEGQQAAPTPKSTAAYGRFDSRTDRAAVISEMGTPDREATTEDGKEQVLFYRAYDLYVVLERTVSGFAYEATVRISDGELLHQRPGA
jgi:hypothetical protein